MPRGPVQEAGWEHEAYAIYVWQSVRRKGETRTKKSRRTLKLPQICVKALQRLQEHQAAMEVDAGDAPPESGLVFCTRSGRPLSAATCGATSAGCSTGLAWSVPSGHRGRCGTASCRCSLTTASPSRTSRAWSATAARPSPATVYRLQIRPIMEKDATAMDGIFRRRRRPNGSGSLVTQLVTHNIEGHDPRLRIMALTWVGADGFEPPTPRL
ncbi:hypothetical protein GCM10009735_62390 [Actinomadura chokoriensis]